MHSGILSGKTRDFSIVKKEIIRKGKAVVIKVLRQELKCQLKLIFHIAEMPSSSHYDACKRAYKGYFRDLINVICNKSLDYVYCLSLKNYIIKYLTPIDQEFQYQNYEYVSRFQSSHVFQSMSRKATYMDNAMADNFFHIIKAGTVHNNHYQSYDNLRYAVNNSIYVIQQ